MAAREVIGVSELRKEELLYELSIRGADTSGSASELARRVREVVDRPVVPPNLEGGQVSDAVSSIKCALGELQSIVSFFEVSEPSRSQINRVRARIIHYIGRAQDLFTVNPSDTKCKELGEQFNDLLVRTQGMLKLGGEATVGELSKPTLGQVACEAPVIPPIKGIDMFAKLPNPLEGLLRDAGTLSLDSIDQVVSTLNFLSKLQDKGEFFGLTDNHFYQLLSPIVSGRLEQLLKDAMRHDLSVSAFRELICRNYLSPRVRHEAIGREYLEVQHDNEPLEKYVQRVKDSARNLCLNYSEAEVVENILQGMRPSDRSRALFCERPQNFGQLEQLINRVQDLAYADQQRGRCNSSQQQVQANCNLARQAGSTEVKCFKCKRNGHTVRNCPAVRCFKCKNWGHMAENCPGKGNDRQL